MVMVMVSTVIQPAISPMLRLLSLLFPRVLGLDVVPAFEMAFCTPLPASEPWGALSSG